MRRYYVRIVSRLRPGVWRLVLLNSIAIAAIFVVLAASPAPVHFPSTHWEALLLACAAAVFLAANVVLAGAAVARSIERGRQAKTDTGTLTTLRACEHFDVIADDGWIGIVDEVMANREGEDEILIVTHGWFGARGFYIPVSDVSSTDEVNKTIRLKSHVAGESGFPDAAG